MICEFIIDAVGGILQMSEKYQYDVAFSFAGAQRDYVEKVKDSLKKYNVSVFYDNDNSVDLWGKNLYRYLDSIYSQKARYCIIFISKEYAERPWTIHESQSAQERMFSNYDNFEFQEYILPVIFDDTRIPGIRSTTGYMDANKLSPDELAEIIAKKIGKKEIQSTQPLSIHDIFKELILLFEENTRDKFYLAYKNEKIFAQIEDVEHGRSLLSIRLFENYITLEQYESISGYNPSIIIFLDNKNTQKPIKIINFSNYLFQSPEQNLNFDDLKRLLDENLSAMLEVKNDLI